MSSSHPTTVEALMALATTYTSIFADLDASAIAPMQSEDFVHEWAPASVNPPPRRNREEFAAHLLRLQTIMRSFPVRAKQIWPNPSLNQVIIWADSETNFHAEARDNDGPEWRYKGEYIFVLSLDHEGKLNHVLEFVDSKGTEVLRSLMARARKNKEGADDAGGNHF